MTDLNLSAIDYPSISTTIADQIRGIIRGGSLRPAQPLSESKIAAQLNVSRGPVREALQLLVQERLLVRIPNRGVFVADITPEDVAEIYELRHALEARCGAKLLDDEPLLHRTVLLLQVIVDRMGAAEQDGQWGEVVELDLSFHTTLVDSSANSRIKRAFSTLMVESSLSINRLERWYPDDASLVQEHQRIIDALAAGDETAFTEALAIHYSVTYS